MGWIALALLMAGAFGLLWRLGVPRDLASFVGAALMLGAAGYALQGRPGLEGQLAAATGMTAEFDPGLAELRLAMFGRFTVAEPYFVASDALARSGARRSAVGVLLGGVNTYPDNFALWTVLGSAYADHDGTVSPAARLAFERALKLAPEHPAPPYFLGLALVRSGEFREASRWWRRALAATPERMWYRADIVRRLTLLERFLASEAGQDAR